MYSTYTSIVATAYIAMLLCSGCGWLDDDHPPCPSDGTGAPVPGSIVEPTTSVGAGDNGATERYRKLSNGTVCVCGVYEIGCHETPEGADSSMSCGYDAQGQPECLPVVRSPDPGFTWDNETGQNVPVLKWSCAYTWRSKRPGKEWKDGVRIRRAQTYTRANLAHFGWCTSKTDDSFEFKCKDCATTPLP